MSAQDGVVVILPCGSDLDPAQIVDERRDWIREAWQQLGDCHAALSATPQQLLPPSIRFALTGEQWNVEYAPTSSGLVRVVTRGGQLTVSGSIGDAESCILALQRWLHARARERLVPIAEREANALGLTPHLSIRGQRYRWGACSLSGHVTLNRKLLFLDAELVAAVMKHELAHLVQPDHSAAFWRTLESYDPAARRHHARLLEAHSGVPAWAEWHRSPEANPPF